MKLVRWVIAGTLFVVIGAGVASAGEETGTITAPDAAQVQELQQRMFGDEEIMAIIIALETNPEVQALLNDPKVVEAVLAGDLNTLQSNPAFLKLLNNPQVKEVTRRLEKQDRGANH
jgi:hypothetical protein